MTIVYNLEGAKGTGKSSLIKRMVERGLADRIHAFTGEWTRLITDDKIYADKASHQRIIHDRGILSHFIYAFLMPADQDYSRVRYNGPKIEISTWRAAHIGMIEDYLNALNGKMIILYTDHDQILTERITRRLELEGKGATEEEWKILSQSNMMYMLFSQFLKAQYPDKILVYRIEKFSSTDELIDQIIEDSKETK